MFTKYLLLYLLYTKGCKYIHLVSFSLIHSALSIIKHILLKTLTVNENEKTLYALEFRMSSKRTTVMFAANLAKKLILILHLHGKLLFGVDLIFTGFIPVFNLGRQALVLEANLCFMHMFLQCTILAKCKLSQFRNYVPVIVKT